MERRVGGWLSVRVLWRVVGVFLLLVASMMWVGVGAVFAQDSVVWWYR